MLLIENKMYITLANIQNGQPVPLVRTLSPCAGAELEIALCDLTYYHRWYNISTVLKNNQIDTTTIRDGYYNYCELDREFFRPLGAELKLHAPSGLLQLSVAKQQTPLILNKRLAKLLGFSKVRFEPGKTAIAGERDDLAIHKVIYAHLSELSTCDNEQDGRPSTLLRVVPVGNERCGSGRTEEFHVLQYRRLETIPISQLTLSLKDINGKMLSCDHITATLHLRNKIKNG